MTTEVKRPVRVWRPPKPDPLTVALGRLTPPERLTYVTVANKVKASEGISAGMAEALLTVIRRLAMETGEQS